MAFAKQFEQFKKLLTEGPDGLEIPEEGLQFMQEVWNQVSWPVLNGTQRKRLVLKNATDVPKKKKTNGYNQFMHFRLEELKKIPTLMGNDRIKMVHDEWKALDETQKVIWNKKTRQINSDAPEAAVAAVSAVASSSDHGNGNESGNEEIDVQNEVNRIRKPSGYNIFMRIMMSVFKQEGVTSTAKMSRVGDVWRSLTDSQKQSWKNVAEKGDPIPDISELKWDPSLSK